MTERNIQSKGFIKCWNYLPETRGLLCYNQNNSINKVQGAMNRQLGLVPGVSDLTLYWGGAASFGEIKTLTGKQSPKQREWMRLVQGHGFEYDILRTPEEIFFWVKEKTRTGIRA